MNETVSLYCLTYPHMPEGGFMFFVAGSGKQSVQGCTLKAIARSFECGLRAKYEQRGILQIIRGSPIGSFRIRRVRVPFPFPVRQFLICPYYLPQGDLHLGDIMFRVAFNELVDYVEIDKPVTERQIGMRSPYPFLRFRNGRIWSHMIRTQKFTGPDA